MLVMSVRGRLLKGGPKWAPYSPTALVRSQVNMYAILLIIDFYASREEVFLKEISRCGDFPEDGSILV